MFHENEMSNDDMMKRCLFMHNFGFVTFKHHVIIKLTEITSIGALTMARDKVRLLGEQTIAVLVG